MRTPLTQKLFTLSFFMVTVLLCAHAASAQAPCLDDADVKRMLVQVNSPQSVSFNKRLQERLLKLRKKDKKRFRENLEENRKGDVMLARMRSSREKNTLDLCPILKEFGWPTTALVGPDGAGSAFALLKNSSSLQLQKTLLPVIVAATKRGDIPKSSFAGYLDRLRLGSGLKQLFGTQTTIIDGFLVLYPIAAEALVESRRKQFELEPLADYLRFLERTYRLPLVKAPGRLGNEFIDDSTNPIAQATTGDLFEGETVDENQVVRISSDLVNLNVSVYSENLKSHVSTLKREDFTVFEDGKAESLSFFAATDVPFDLVLLIDLSGSTAGKRGLIRETTRRFVEAARPGDRLAIVTFADDTNVVSPLTADREKLLASIAKIEGTGGSHVWDALKFTLDQVVGPRTLQRRRAVVFMTDGADNALLGYDAPALRGSLISFANLLEAVRRTDALIIPVYLDTEGDDYQSQRVYENARKTLALLADESGGLYYKARKLEDLNGIYTRVIEDLGKIYSLGYKPSNQKHDASWRSVRIQIANRPELIPRTRPGYYAN